MIQLRKAKRSKAFIKLSVRAASGCGKTYSSLLLAKGLTNDWSKVCVIDTENGSADLYEDLGEYNVISLDKFSPEAYIEAIKVCLSNGIECIVIDGISNEWDWILDYQQALGGKVICPLI